MRNFLIAAAAMTAFAALTVAPPAKADMHYGPTQSAGKCFKWSAGNGRDSTFGYWDTCPAPASTAAKPAATKPAKR